MTRKQVKIGALVKILKNREFCHHYFKIGSICEIMDNGTTPDTIICKDNKGLFQTVHIHDVKLVEESK